MSRLFILTLTLIVLIALASAGWLTLGAIAGDYDPVPQHPWASKSMSGRRVYHRDTSKAESNNLFTTASEEDQEQAAFDDFAPSAEYESNEFAEAVPFTPNEQAENPFADDPPAGQEALRAEPFEAPRDSKRKPSSTGLLRIRSDEAPDLDQPTRNEIEELARKFNVEARMIDSLIERDPKIVELLLEAEKIDNTIRNYEEKLKDPANNSLLKAVQHEREEIEKAIQNRRQELRPLLKERMHTQFAAGERESRHEKFLEQRARQRKDQPKSMRFIELMETEKNRHANAGPEEREIQRKIEHLQRAIENLNEAGMKQKTQELQLHVDKMRLDLEQRQFQREFEERKRRQRRERKHADHTPRDDVHEALNDLRHEIRNLRNEVREMHELLEQHVKHGGKIEVELNPRNIEIEVEEELRPFDKRDIKKRDSERIEIEEIDIQALREEEIEEEHEERPLPTPDYDLPPINQPEQIEEEAEVLPSEENNVEAY
ncbi:hypothetical protein Pan258_04250 [Symmachiella dynata]|uniref:hypothetical protein n=1 Tax=Symmachiella dynata TaxID=2527995 RepID=UPI00118AF9C2|nr:hypothetical protein [Symmachiella dynata]QDT46406.1 hypothetical protein Pan258_04250 [Symmachiella dynata]